jgi:hypothetical protein
MSAIDDIMSKHMGNTGWNGHLEAKVYQEAKQELESLMLGVLGSDEELPKQTIPGIGVNVPIEPYIRNQFRQELRSKVKELFNG